MSGIYFVHKAGLPIFMVWIYWLLPEGMKDWRGEGHDKVESNNFYTSKF